MSPDFSALIATFYCDICTCFVRGITEQKKLMTFPTEALKPRGGVRRDHVDTASQPGLEGTLYESMCTVL